MNELEHVFRIIQALLLDGEMKIQEEIAINRFSLQCTRKTKELITIKSRSRINQSIPPQKSRRQKVTRRLPHVEQANPLPGEVPHRPTQRRLALLDVPTHRAAASISPTLPIPNAPKAPDSIDGFPRRCNGEKKRRRLLDRHRRRIDRPRHRRFFPEKKTRSGAEQLF